MSKAASLYKAVILIWHTTPPLWRTLHSALRRSILLVRAPLECILLHTRCDFILCGHWLTGGKRESVCVSGLHISSFFLPNDNGTPRVSVLILPSERQISVVTDSRETVNQTIATNQGTAYKMLAHRAREHKKKYQTMKKKKKKKNKARERELAKSDGKCPAFRECWTSCAVKNEGTYNLHTQLAKLSFD